MSNDPLSLASGAAQGFQVFQCETCADHIRDALIKGGYGGQLVEIRGAGGRDFIICLSYDGGQATITQNGRHLGVRVGDTIFDNLHPGGMPYEDWLNDFDAVGGIRASAVTNF